MKLIHKEFLIALANGEEVEQKLPLTGAWIGVSSYLSLITFNNPDFEFRLILRIAFSSNEITLPIIRTGWYNHTGSPNRKSKQNPPIQAANEIIAF